MHARLPVRSKYIYILFCLVSIVVYSTSFDNTFRDDDFIYIRSAAGFDDPREPFRTSELYAFYRPGAMILFWMEYRLFGPENSGAYLAFNFVIHVLISLCLVRVLRLLGMERRPAYLAGGLFVLGLGHYGKQVMWACTIGPLFAILMVLCTMCLVLAYLGARADAEAFRRRQLIGSGILMLAAPAFHEIGLIAPVLTAALVCTYGGWSDRSHCRGRVVLPLVPAVLALSVWASVFYFISSEYEAYRVACHTIVQAPLLLFRHLGFMLLPVKPSPAIDGQPGPIQWLLSISGPLHAAIAVAIVAVSLYLLFRGKRAARFLVVWFYIALAPFCLVDIPVSWLELRYIYCASMPLCALIAIVLVEGLYARGGWRRWAAISLTILAAAMTIYVTVTLEMKYGAPARDYSTLRNLQQLWCIHTQH